MFGMNFGDLQDKRVVVVVHQVPGIAGKLTGHMVEKACRAEKRETDPSTQHMTQQAVEADKMIHMGVADEGMADFKKISGLQDLNVPEVEDEGTFLKQKGNKKTGISLG